MRLVWFGLRWAELGSGVFLRGDGVWLQYIVLADSGSHAMICVLAISIALYIASDVMHMHCRVNRCQ